MMLFQCQFWGLEAGMFAGSNNTACCLVQSGVKNVTLVYLMLYCILHPCTWYLKPWRWQKPRGYAVSFHLLQHNHYWYISGVVNLMCRRLSLVPRPRPAFRHFQYGKLGGAWERGYRRLMLLFWGIHAMFDPFKGCNQAELASDEHYVAT